MKELMRDVDKDLLQLSEYTKSTAAAMGAVPHRRQSNLG